MNSLESSPHSRGVYYFAGYAAHGLAKLFYPLETNYQPGRMNLSETIKGVGETLAELIDKLAGKGTNLQLTFNDLSLEWAGLKTRLNGSVVLDILYVSEKSEKAVLQN